MGVRGEYELMVHKTVTYGPVGKATSLGEAVESCYHHMTQMVPKPVSCPFRIEMQDPDSNRRLVVEVTFSENRVCWESEGSIEDVMEDLGGEE